MLLVAVITDLTVNNPNSSIFGNLFVILRISAEVRFGMIFEEQSKPKHRKLKLIILISVNNFDVELKTSWY